MGPNVYTLMKFAPFFVQFTTVGKILCSKVSQFAIVDQILCSEVPLFTTVDQILWSEF